jgi:maleylpyruvate isomerase
VGHVLTHVARNADSIVLALDGARRGVVVDRYPGGAARREADIEAGAGRPAAELVDDVLMSAARLEAAWDGLDDVAWARPGSSTGRPEPIAELPFRRLREVEVHHVDLDLGFEPEDWSAFYIGVELRNAGMAWRSRMPMGQTNLPAAALALPVEQRLAWLLGRRDVEGLPRVKPWW